MTPFNAMRLRRAAPPAPSAAWNPADKDADISLSVSDTVATLVSGGSEIGMVRGVDAHAAGSYQFEATATTTGTNNSLVGLANASAPLANFPGDDPNGWSYNSNDGGAVNNGVGSVYGAIYTTEVIGCVWYATEGTIVFYRDAVFQGTAFTGVSDTLYPAWGPGVTTAATRTCTLNTGTLAYPVGGVTNWVGGTTPSSTSAWNPADKDSDISLLAADMQATLNSGGGANGSVRGTLGRASGSGVYQCEFITFGPDAQALVGMSKAAASLAIYPGGDANGYAYYQNSGEKYNNNTGAAYGATWANKTDIIGMVWDAAAGTLTFYKNGASQGTAFTSLSGTMYPAWGPGTGGAGVRRCYINTGSSAFIYPIGGATAWG